MWLRLDAGRQSAHGGRAEAQARAGGRGHAPRLEGLTRRSDQRVTLAAVDGNAGASHQTGTLAAQKCNDVAHFVRSAKATQRELLGDEARHALRVLLLAAPPAAAWERDRA